MIIDSFGDLLRHVYTFHKEYQAVIEVSEEYRLKNFCLGRFHKKNTGFKRLVTLGPMKVNEVMLTNKQVLKKSKLLHIIVSLNYFHFPQNKKAYSTKTKKSKK